MLAQPLVERVLNAATQCVRAVAGSCVARACDTAATCGGRYLLHREGPKFVVSTMHDISLAPLLGTLGAYDRRWPPLASHVAFEVWGPPEQRGDRTKLKGASQWQVLRAWLSNSSWSCRGRLQSPGIVQRRGCDTPARMLPSLEWQRHVPLLHVPTHGDTVGCVVRAMPGVEASKDYTVDEPIRPPKVDAHALARWRNW